MAGKDDDIIVRAAIRHLARTLNDPPTVEQLARAVGTHEKRLSRAFRDNLGQTVFEYLRHERLRIAQDLLDSTSLSIASIAKEIGFSTPANFATAFRERFGLTPTEWRRQRHAGERAVRRNRNATRRAAARVRDYQLYFAVASTVRSLPNTQTAYDWQPLT